MFHSDLWMLQHTWNNYTLHQSISWNLVQSLPKFINLFFTECLPWTHHPTLVSMCLCSFVFHLCRMSSPPWPIITYIITGWHKLKHCCYNDIHEALFNEWQIKTKLRRETCRHNPKLNKQITSFIHSYTHPLLYCCSSLLKYFNYTDYSLPNVHMCRHKNVILV